LVFSEDPIFAHSRSHVHVFSFRKNTILISTTEEPVFSFLFLRNDNKISIYPHMTAIIPTNYSRSLPDQDQHRKRRQRLRLQQKRHSPLHCMLSMIVVVTTSSLLVRSFSLIATTSSYLTRSFPPGSRNTFTACHKSPFIITTRLQQQEPVIFRSTKTMIMAKMSMLKMTTTTTTTSDGDDNDTLSSLLGGRNLISIEDCIKASKFSKKGDDGDNDDGVIAESVVFIDGSWYHRGGRDGRQEFKNGPRIKGAKYIDMDDIATAKELFPNLNPKGLPHMLPPKVNSVCHLYVCVCVFRQTRMIFKDSHE